MTKPLRRVTTFALSLLALMPTGWSGPLFPAVGAAMAANGKFLVIMDSEYLNPDQQIRTITRVKYRVLRREEFINDKFTSPNPFWSDDWELDMVPPKGEGIPLPFISNDGKYLVLVSTDPPFFDFTVLRIFREHHYGGEDLLRTYKLKDIWTADDLKAHADMASSGRPLWFAGSTLAFSADGSEFVVTVPEGREVRLDLNGGAIHSQ